MIEAPGPARQPGNPDGRSVQRWGWVDRVKPGPRTLIPLPRAQACASACSPGIQSCQAMPLPKQRAESQDPWCAADGWRVSNDRCMRRGLGFGLKQAKQVLACVLCPSSLLHLLLIGRICPYSAQGSLPLLSAFLSLHVFLTSAEVWTAAVFSDAHFNAHMNHLRILLN